jgi:hypothetical protein
MGRKKRKTRLCHLSVRAGQSRHLRATTPSTISPSQSLPNCAEESSGRDSIFPLSDWRASGSPSAVPTCQCLETVVRTLRMAFLAGAAAIAASGFVGAATADSNPHILTVRLPDGSVEHIRYVGDQPPEVSLDQETGPLASPASDLFGADAVFADLDRMSADMDRRAAAMLEEARRMEAHAFAGSDPLLLDFGKLPGWRGYSVVSTMSGNHICTRSVQHSSSSDGRPPRVVTRTSGDCGLGHSRSTSSPSGRSVEPVGRPPLLEVNDRPSETKSERGLLQSVSASESRN